MKRKTAFIIMICLYLVTGAAACAILFSSAASLPPCLLLHSMAKAAPSGLRSMHTTGNSRFSIFWVEKRPEQRIMPHTLFSLQRFIISTSDFSSPFVTKTIREYPLSLVAFSIQDNKTSTASWAKRAGFSL